MTTASPSLLVHARLAPVGVSARPVGVSPRPVGRLSRASRAGLQLPEHTLRDGPGVYRLALPVADLALRLLLSPGDLGDDVPGTQQPSDDEARDEAGQGQHPAHGAFRR